MIQRLTKKFILICTVCILLLILLIFAAICILNIQSTNGTMDELTDSLTAGNGRFPDSFDPSFHYPDPFGPETRFSTRYFTVWYDRSDKLILVNTEFIHSVDAEEAAEYAELALKKDQERGWIDHYRYKAYDTPTGSTLVFVDGSSRLNALYQNIVITLVVLLSATILILMLIILISRRVMRPVAESYEKQKQFITDASHELKTPLTLILTNLEIARQELGENEWLEDVRSEGQRMTVLVNQLVSLSRMNEEGRQPQMTQLDLSELVADTASEFASLLTQRQIQLYTDIGPGITCTGNEILLRRLVSILMDNATKYCDPGGAITLRLQKQWHITLQVENTCHQVDQLDLDRLFDRFYRADKARTASNSFGIGLSMARSIMEKHNGAITAYKAAPEAIGFRVTLNK